MTAGNHRIIIEKGADYRIELQVSENGIDMKDVAGYSVKMVLKHENDTGGIVTDDTIQGYLTEDTEGSGTYLNGYIGVTIDKAVTATYETLVPSNLNAFATEYNYFYHIDLIEDTTTSSGKDNIRVLRGKAAVRE